MFSDVLPLRAILLQSLFLLLAIALDSVAFQRLLNQDYKTSTQSAITINLFSTVIGWVTFFTLHPLLPRGLKIQLLSYIFFNRFVGDPWLPRVSPVLVLLSLLIFMGTFFAKLSMLNWIDKILKFGTQKQSTAPEATIAKPPKIRSNRVQRGQNIATQMNSQSYAVLVGNSASFSIILIVLVVLFIQEY